MKRILVFVFCIMALVAMFSFTASAATAGYYTYTVTDGKATITDVSESINGDVTIPTFLGGYPVTSVGYDAFHNCTRLTSITIPDNVTSIGAGAFRVCTSLTSITIPDSVRYISYDAFRDCTSLTSIVIPDSVKEIGSGIFSGCRNLENITIPFVGEILEEYYPQYPFGYIFGEVSYTGGVPTTQYYYDWSPNNKTHYTTSSTYYIPEKLKSVTVTGGNILYGAFYNCTNLTSITIGDAVTSIEKDAFYNCTNLMSITIGEGVTSIGEGAFSGCSNLESMTIPFVGESRNNRFPFGYIFGTSGYTDGVHTVQKQYHYYDDNSTSYTYYIPKKLKSITVTGGDILSGAFCNCKYLKSITIDYGITSIGKGAFSGCSNLTSIVIPDSVTSIGKGAFSGCGNLTSMTIPFVGESRNNRNSFGYIFGTSSYTGSIATYQYYDMSHYSVYYIPYYLRTVTVTGGNILYGAFDDCQLLKSIIIPNDITYIGDYAFYNCKSLTSITISDSVTSIGKGTFAGCVNLTNLIVNANNPVYHSIGNGIEEHRYDNACDTTCNVCDYVREVPDHIYDNACDATCNICNDVRDITHDFEWVIDEEENCGVDGKKREECTVCHTTRNENTVIPATGNHTYDNACDTTCNVCEHVREITHDYGDEWLCDGKYHWQKCSVCERESEKSEHTAVDGVCTVCGADCYVPGDVDGQEGITANDAIYLLYNVFFGDEAYPVDQPCDFDGDSSVTANDAIYLLYHVFFGDESYPLD